MKSVVERLGTEDFPRLRIGVGPVPPGQDPAVYVLKPISKSHLKDYARAIDRAHEALEAVLRDGVEKAMNSFNAA